MALARADLEHLLRTRQLDRTLTTSLPPLDPHDEYAVGATGISALDARLGGLPRGQLSEIVGSRSTGRTSIALQLLASAMARGERVALIDALDMFDVASAAAAGLDLHRLLWIRGHVVTNPGLCRDMNRRALDQTIRALSLVLSAGTFGLVVFDVAEAPLDALRRLPFTTWLRLQRLLEGRHTVGVLVAPDSVARSSAGLTVRLTRASAHTSRHDRAVLPLDARVCEERAPTGLRRSGRLFDGVDSTARVVRARAHAHEDAAVALATRTAVHV